MEEGARGPRPLPLVALLLALGALLLAGFAALGLWQLERLEWKRDLLAQIERQLAAAPAAAPGPAQWNSLSPADGYRRVQVRGRFDHGRQALVRASTVLGSGYWVLTPLRTEDGWWVLVNRGFVPPELRERVPQGPAVQEVAGLLRPGEPGGGLLQANAPAQDRWYSRDVAAIAAARGLHGPVAPYFIDAQAGAGADPGAWPRPGLTVLRFANNHLVYALTWFALAAIMALAIGWLALDERRLRRQARAAARVPSSH